MVKGKIIIICKDNNIKILKKEKPNKQVVNYDDICYICMSAETPQAK